MSDELKRIREGEGSKFNSAIADLERINELLILCNRFSMEKKYDCWLVTLHTLEREIGTWMSKEELKELAQKRVNGIPPDKGAWQSYFVKLDDYERALRDYRAKKKLGIIANEDARSAALR